LTYSTREETLTALLNKNNIIYKKNKLKICEATPKKTQLFVGGLKSEVNNEMLMKKFSEFGDVHEANVKIDPRTGYSRCFGFVTFIDSDHVCKKLIERRFMEFDGKTIEVKKATPITDYFRQIKEKSGRGRQTAPHQQMQSMTTPQFQNPMYQLNQQMMQMSLMNGGNGFMIPMMNPMMVPISSMPQQMAQNTEAVTMMQQQQQMMAMMQQQQLAQQQLAHQQMAQSQTHQAHPHYSMHSPPSPVQVKQNALPLFVENSASSSSDYQSEDYIDPFFRNGFQ